MRQRRMLRRYAHLFSFFLYLSPPLPRCGEHLLFAACSARNIAKKNAGANLWRTILKLSFFRERGESNRFLLRILSLRALLKARRFYLLFIFYIISKGVKISPFHPYCKRRERHGDISISAPQFTLNSPFFRPIFILWRFRAVLVANSRDGAQNFFLFFYILFSLSKRKKRKNAGCTALFF